MSREGGKSGAPGARAGRHVTPDEAELWSRTTVSVEKVKVKPRVATHAAEAAPAPPQSAKPGPARAKRQAAAPPELPPPRPPARPQPVARPVAEFDRRSLRKVSTGKVAIDATLDLHGLQRDDAHARLRTFLHNSQAQGHRMVLVITGKGGGTESDDHFSRTLGRPERGVLRRKVPQWLEEADLRALVVRYTSASRSHGGSGAFYVQLRKARDA
jgi:DNA-nicking Smr family endonuclease